MNLLFIPNLICSIMSRITLLVVFMLGISFALFSSCILDYFQLWNTLGYGSKSAGSFLPFDHDLYPHSDILNPKYLNPGTDLAPKDPRSAQKSECIARNVHVEWIPTYVFDFLIILMSSVLNCHHILCA